MSKGTRKRDTDMEPLDSTNIGRFTESMRKFATWLNEWMLAGKMGLSKQTFSSRVKTSQSFPLLIQRLLEIIYWLEIFNQIHLKSTLEYIANLMVLTILVVMNSFYMQKNQWQSNISSNFRVYNERGKQHKGNDSLEAQAEVEHCGNIITEMLLPRPYHAHMTQMDADSVLRC